MIEVDPETGKFEFLRYAAVHDAGTIVNPKTLNGQIIGGTVQGLGTALLEEYRYDDQGRVLARSDQTVVTEMARLDLYEQSPIVKKVVDDASAPLSVRDLLADVLSELPVEPDQLRIDGLIGASLRFRNRRARCRNPQHTSTRRRHIAA